MKRAFTIVELLVAVGILAIVLSFAGAIFRVSIDAHRTAMANSEIMQKFRAITEQLDADFQGLRRDGEIFAVWVAEDADSDGTYERFDRIMFFADGDFHSYHADPPIRGNLARISYMLAKRGTVQAQAQPPRERMLARVQHIVTADASLPAVFDPNAFTDSEWFDWNNRMEYQKGTLQQWVNLSWEDKEDALAVIADVNVGSSTIDHDFRGASIEPTDANSIHMLLCRGVGEFKVQGWYDAELRWVPQVDPDGDGDLSDTEFYFSGSRTPGVLYPYPPNGLVSIKGVAYPRNGLSESRFDEIPGLGRALKFTFTLYDSRGIIKEGRTFTHIIYLDN